MKISASVRSEYYRQKVLNELIKASADTLIIGRKPRTWHYESRIKAIISFAQKIETGRFNPRVLDDFYACTLVVPNLASTSDAEALIGELFDVVSRKPTDDSFASYDATSFLFDQTRIYAKLRPSPGMDAQPIHSIPFEIQVKTFLEHAWSIATHDLTYKTSNVSWGKERVAAQVKAALEAAEVAILEADALASGGNRILGRRNQHTSDLVSIIDSLVQSLHDHELPDDMKRLAESVHTALTLCHVPIAELLSLMEEGCRNRGGRHPLDLSPYSIVIQYLVDVRQDKILRALRKSGGRDRIFVASEVILPETLNLKNLPRALTIDTAA